MTLEATPVYRNLATRVTFLGLEAEDLFAILALAVVSNILGSCSDPGSSAATFQGGPPQQPP